MSNPQNWRELMLQFNMADVDSRRKFYPFLVAAFIRDAGGVIEINDAVMRECYNNIQSSKPWPMNISETANGIRVTLD